MILPKSGREVDSATRIVAHLRLRIRSYTELNHTLQNNNECKHCLEQVLVHDLMHVIVHDVMHAIVHSQRVTL